VLFWAIAAHTTAAWVVLGLSTALALSGVLAKYVLPGRLMARAAVSTSSTLAGAALGIVGFFLIPVVGAFLGFALGVYLAERITTGTHAAAWSSTRHALKAMGLSLGIEMLTGVAMATAWLIGVTAVG
jgi:hypothetical protein